jgi:hypothetical protein
LVAIWPVVEFLLPAEAGCSPGGQALELLRHGESAAAA